MSDERNFARGLRIERGFIACDEVSSYGCIADVLAIDVNKERIIEYEFKRNSNDLKIAEKKKSKYGIHKRNYKGKLINYFGKDGRSRWGFKVLKPSQRPHQFYFVVTKELYEKEKKYLHGLDSFTGVMAQMCEDGKFYVMKRSSIRKNNLQKYDCVLRDISKRLANIFSF